MTGISIQHGTCLAELLLEEGYERHGLAIRIPVFLTASDLPFSLMNSFAHTNPVTLHSRWQNSETTQKSAKDLKRHPTDSSDRLVNKMMNQEVQSSA